MFFSLIPFLATAAELPRVEENIDTAWRFYLGDLPAAKEADFDDATWRNLDVPHDWSIEGDYSAQNPSSHHGAYLPGGIGWYRRAIELPANTSGREIKVIFDAVYMNSDVWLNGVRVGGRPYGYISFECDLTPHLRPGRNVLAVRVDNTLEPSARWYHGCGIYGHVRLISTDKVHVPTDGVFVQTPVATAANAQVRAAVEVRNASAQSVAVEVRGELLDPDGVVVGSTSSPQVLAAGETATVSQTLDVARPRRWSLKTPQQYAWRTTVVKDKIPLDVVKTRFGIRSLRFDADTGFYLNEEHVKLKGVCEHQGGSPVGAAMPEALLERRLRQLQSMGVNAIRVSHNPELPQFYRLCDRLGILVMDEIFDGWHKKAPQDYGGRFFAEWWKQDVTAWVRRDRNHPSVIMWSIGNETGKNDDYNMSALIRSLDATRPTTGGAVITGVDVAGFNGGIVPSDAVLEEFHQKNPKTPIVMTEEPHSFQTRGFYRTENSIFKAIEKPPHLASPELFTGDSAAYRSSYDNVARRLTARHAWKRTLSRPWVMGEFRWTGFDYLGEAFWSGNESLAREFNFGVIDLAGFPKDHYFFYQSIWTEQPMIHLLPHWTHPGLEDKKIPIVAYANADEAELFQDGVSLGKLPASDEFQFVWHVPYRAGELKAVAYRQGKSVAETVQRTSGAPARLAVTTDNAALAPRRQDLALVSFAVQDDRGIVVPTANHRIDFALIGPARYLGAENGDPVDVTAHRLPWRNAFMGLARAFYAGQDNAAAPVEVVALSALGFPYFETTAAVTLACERVALRGPLATAAIEVRFTTDGSAPTSDSKRYTAPIKLDATTTIRAAAYQGKRELVGTTATFTRGPKPARPPYRGPRGDQGVAEDAAPTKAK